MDGITPSPHNLISELRDIKSYILDSITSECEKQLPPGDPFFHNLDEFLERLIIETDGEIQKDRLKTKVSRQLLCCIGIDLISGAVPLQHYAKIFQLIDYNNKQIEARHLFSNCVSKHELLYRESGRKDTDTYKIMVCPVCDWKHYIDPKKMTGLIGEQQMEFAYRRLLKLEASGLLVLFSSQFYKGKYGHFWITTEDKINELLQEDGAAINIVDTLGLSHFDFNKMDYQYYFKLKIGKASFETFKPNATIVDWKNPETGFLSFSKQDHGLTFSITGYSHGRYGMHERVFTTLNLDEDDRKACSISPLKPKVSPPFQIQCEDIITEGIQRFRTKQTVSPDST